jgi:hypothetical protein
MGSSVALAGDVNGDGLSDVIVGVPGADAAGTASGRAFLYFGRTGSFDATPRGTLDGTAGNETFGPVVAERAPDRPAASRAPRAAAAPAQPRAWARRSSSAAAPRPAGRQKADASGGGG